MTSKWETQTTFSTGRVTRVREDPESELRCTQETMCDKNTHPLAKKKIKERKNKEEKRKKKKEKDKRKRKVDYHFSISPIRYV